MRTLIGQLVKMEASDRPTLTSFFLVVPTPPSVTKLDSVEVFLASEDDLESVSPLWPSSVTISPDWGPAHHSLVIN